MYSTDRGAPPKKPVVPSLTAAEAEVRAWARASRIDPIVDADGQAWRLEVRTVETPAKEAPKELSFEVRLHLSTELDQAALVRAKTFDPVQDERLLALVGDERFVVAMRPVVFAVTGVEAARQRLAEELPKVRARLADPSLREVKRTLVSRWVDQAGVFGKGLDEEA